MTHTHSAGKRRNMVHHPLLRRFFHYLNRFLMVPHFRLGLGMFVGNPFTGYIMVIKTTGRRTGRARYTPVNYAIADGNVYCLSGWGEASHWYRNLMADPRVELLMPHGAVQGIAEVVTDPAEALQVTRQVLINGGFAGFFLGFNPRTALPALIVERARGTPVIRIRPVGIGSGAGDPGGWLWALAFAVLAWLGLRRSRK